MNSQPPVDVHAIDDIRNIVARAWLALQSEYAHISDACLPLSMSDKMVLRMVHAREDIILREIRELLGVPHSTLTSVIDRLEEHGLVQRTLTERDRRSFGLKLTVAGQAYMDMHERSERELAARILHILGSEINQHQFVDLLSRVVDGLDRRTPN